MYRNCIVTGATKVWMKGKEEEREKRMQVLDSIKEAKSFTKTKRKAKDYNK